MPWYFTASIWDPRKYCLPYISDKVGQIRSIMICTYPALKKYNKKAYLYQYMKEGIGSHLWAWGHVADNGLCPSCFESTSCRAALVLQSPWACVSSGFQCPTDPKTWFFLCDYSVQSVWINEGLCCGLAELWFYSLKPRASVTCPRCSQKACGWWSAQIPLKKSWRNVLTVRRWTCCQPFYLALLWSESYSKPFLSFVPENCGS